MPVDLPKKHARPSSLLGFCIPLALVAFYLLCGAVKLLDPLASVTEIAAIAAP